MKASAAALRRVDLVVATNIEGEASISSITSSGVARPVQGGPTEDDQVYVGTLASARSAR